MPEDIKSDDEAARRWAELWLSGVADGSNTMSQRKRTSIERLGGGLDVVKEVAESLGVHLVLLEDDKGNELVAASVHPFQVLC